VNIALIVAKDLHTSLADLTLTGNLDCLPQSAIPEEYWVLLAIQRPDSLFLAMPIRWKNSLSSMLADQLMQCHYDSVCPNPVIAAS
jgi:hypothetical protein